MLFNSYIFIFLFVPITVVGFFLIARRFGHMPAVSWLSACSLFFYGWWNPIYLPLLLASIFANYILGYLLASPTRSDAARKTILILGLIANLALLGYFKYANFFLDNLNTVIGTRFSSARIILPLGISFYTFQKIAYLVDCYRREVEEYSLIEFSLFVSFFPQLIAGPITHHKEIIPPFASRKTDQPHIENFAIGIALFTMGLFKKVMIADALADPANKIFAAAAGNIAPAFVLAWVGSLAYTLQLYFDFSGYSDMAIGLGRLFGVTIPTNFNSPYKAVNIVDFWRRWHMTLSRFLRDYLYIPLGGNRRGNVRRYVNLLLTMLLGGLWHGAAWTFVIWGALHGLYLVINHAWQAAFPRWAAPSPLRRTISTAVTFLAVVAGWVIFRAKTLHAGKLMLKGMVGLNGIALSQYHGHGKLIVGIAALLLFAWFAPNSQEIFSRASFEYSAPDERSRQTPARLVWSAFMFKPNTIWATILAAAFVVSVMSMDRVQEFLYWQF
jgi:D-alanyl-lipoteichoic acid acyltransferase DltB (MBOAT superfamily)